MRTTLLLLRAIALSILLTGALAHAASVTGTVTNKTTNKPAVGDQVVLVDVQAGMGEVAHATTDARGHYSLNLPGASPYLVRVTHQGAGYFIAAPQGGGQGDLTVYDVAAKVQGISIEADVIEVEGENGQLRVNERYFVHNTSSPPVTQWSEHSFEVVLPVEAVLEGVGARRPNGLPTSTKIDPAGAKGHYTFNFPIQPDDGEKDTVFQISYHLPYSGGKFNFKSQVLMPADNLAVLVPKSMSFAAGSGAGFTPVQQDPGIMTYIAKNVTPDRVIEFTVSGNGSIPREAQGAPAGQQPAGDGEAQADTGPNAKPGGGIGVPIDTPDPLSKYKWWILAALALLLAAAAAFLLRKQTDAPVATALPAATARTSPVIVPAMSKDANLLNALKEELFLLESEKISGKLPPKEYAEVKAALEVVLKRALKRSS